MNEMDKTLCMADLDTLFKATWNEEREKDDTHIFPEETFHARKKDIVDMLEFKQLSLDTAVPYNREKVKIQYDAEEDKLTLIKHSPYMLAVVVAAKMSRKRRTE